MTDTDLMETVVDRMGSADVAYLSIIGAEGYPRTRAMLNLRNREQYPDHVHLYTEHNRDLLVYLTTNTSSLKRSELDANPRVCIYYCHPADFFGVALTGDMEIIDDMALKESLWVDWWSRYYPTGKPDDPDFTLLRLMPKEVRGWYQGKKFSFGLPA